MERGGGGNTAHCSDSVHPLTHIVHFQSQFGSLNTASGICSQDL